jgi:hypothetical protein
LEFWRAPPHEGACDSLAFEATPEGQGFQRLMRLTVLQGLKSAEIPHKALKFDFHDKYCPALSLVPWAIVL